LNHQLKAEMKARAFGMDVNTAAMREAALAYATRQVTATALTKAIRRPSGNR
jgi:hypothetical protein